jgi:hypothetical protein
MPPAIDSQIHGPYEKRVAMMFKPVFRRGLGGAIIRRADLTVRALGGVLCLAAVLKGMFGFGSTLDRFESILSQVGSVVELAVGVVLVLRIRPSISVPVGSMLFVLLAGVSWIGTVRGAANCGCFGAIALPPWIMLVFDGGAAVALIGWSRSSGAWSKTQDAALVAACIGGAYVGMGVGSIIYPRLGPVATASSPEAIAAADTVIIDPADLRGRAFLLLPYIRIGADLSRGEWKVILAKPGCSRCEQRLRAGECEPDGKERVAVVLGKEKEGWNLYTECRAVLGQLNADKKWQFEAPLIFRLTDGRVTETLKADERKLGMKPARD